MWPFVCASAGWLCDTLCVHLQDGYVTLCVCICRIAIMLHFIHRMCCLKPSLSSGLTSVYYISFLHGNGYICCSCKENGFAISMCEELL